MNVCTTDSVETLAEALAKLLCREKHSNDGGGYCVSCLSRAKQVGVPALIASGAVRPAAEVRAEALREAEREVPTEVARLVHKHFCGTPPSCGDQRNCPGNADATTVRAIRQTLRARAALAEDAADD